MVWGASFEVSLLIQIRYSYGALARPLTSLLDEVSAPSAFDLLSLDVEGNELAVLKGLDFRKYQPKWMLVETRNSDVSDYLSDRSYEEVAKLSEYKGYSDILYRCTIDGVD